MYYLPFVAVFTFYLVVVRMLRNRRRDDIQRRFPHKTREEMGTMSLSEAATVMRELAEQEFPMIFNTSIGFALFKTYGIPTISKLLVATSQLSGDATASKRRTDTAVLISEIMLNDPKSPRSIDSVARVNFLHDRWRKAGKISNDDLLYTLSLFALEPIRWTTKYEWRELTPIEKNAMAIFWRDVGLQMDISYDRLLPYLNQKDDPIAWIDALQAWSLEYQEKHMAYSIPNEKLAHANVHLLLFDLPRFMRGFVFSQLRCVMEPQLRHAMGYEDPSRLQFAIFNKLVTVRRWILRHLCLPRPSWWINPTIQEADKKTGRYFLANYLAHPYYIKPTLNSRWGPSAMCSRLLGNPLPGDEGEKYLPDGYMIPEVGPENQRGKGKDQMDIDREKIASSRGCPMAVHV